MSEGINTLTIIGNISKDAELRFTQGGMAVTGVNVAVNNKYTNGAGEKVEKVTWVTVTLWGKFAEAMHKYLTKGTQIYVEGEASVSAYAKQDGTPGASLELRANNLKLLGSRNGNGNGTSADTEGHTAPAGSTDDIPF